MGLGTLPMQAPELAVKEMERCVKELGFPGVQIGSHINELDLNAQELFPIYAVSIQHSLSQCATGPGTVLGVLCTFPHLRFITAPESVGPIVPILQIKKLKLREF